MRKETLTLSAGACLTNVKYIMDLGLQYSVFHNVSPNFIIGYLQVNNTFVVSFVVLTSQILVYLYSRHQHFSVLITQIKLTIFDWHLLCAMTEYHWNTPIPLSE